MTFNDPAFKAFNDSVLTTCLRRQIFLGACSGDLRTSIMRASPALLPRPRAQPWRPASSHMPWLNRDPTHRTEKTTGAGIFHTVEPDVASALTITNAQGRLPTPHPLFAESDTGLGSASRGLSG